MQDPTIEFDLITFHDLRAAPYSGAPIPRFLLRDRIIFAKTNLGNIAKFQVHSAENLLITRLTVYGPDGCIARTCADLVIPNGHSCNLDTASETSSGNDFKWEENSEGVYQLKPENGATFHLCPGFDEITFDHVQNAEYQSTPVERIALRDQVILCKTGRGRYAKLLLEGGNNLLVRRLVVYNSDGSVHLDCRDITVPRTWLLDIDSGQAVNTGGDLWWRALNDVLTYLTPANGAGISYRSYFRFEKYLSLTRNAAIRSVLIFSGASGVQAYDDWSEIKKLDLNEFLYLREIEQDFPITHPPALVDNIYMNESDAWKIYLAHIAQSFWIDVHDVVPWKLSTSHQEHLSHLLDMRKLMLFTQDCGYSFDLHVLGAVTDWNPVLSYKFLVAESMVKPDQWQTIQLLTDWCRANLKHMTEELSNQYDYQYGYLGHPPVDKMIYPLPGRDHVTEGCWGTDGFLAAVFRTVNIPVRHGRSEFNNGEHSRAEFFTVGMNLAHGDDPYNGWTALGKNGVPNVPIHRIFYDNALLDSLITSPTPLPGKTMTETTDFNHRKRAIELAVEYKTRYLLFFRCVDVVANNQGANRQLWQELHDYYSDAQIAHIEAGCDSVLATIDGGCNAL